MNNSEPFIAIDFWINYSDIVMEHKNQAEKYEEEINKLHETNDCVVIFLKTDLIHCYIDILFSLEKPFILITASNDDHCPPFLSYPVDDEMLKMRVDALMEKPELIFWFAKNPCILHRKLSAYPLGPKWQWKTTRFFGEDKTTHFNIYDSLCKTPKKSMLERSKKFHLLYFNFNQTTNNPLYTPHKNIRHTVKNELLKRFSWNKNEPFETYMNVLNTYKFCVSPPGRGIDTHRCWEALMMGTIPILCSTPIDYLFDNLPVIIVKDDEWHKITPDYLTQQYEIILKNIDQYDFSSLYTDYWIKMLSSKKNDHDVGCPPL